MIIQIVNRSKNMDIQLQTPRGFFAWLRVWGLYRTAFPRAERKPFSMIRRMIRLGKTDTWCVVESGRFAGIAITINGPDKILLDYFAVEKAKRGSGVGTAALKKLMERYADKGFFLEIESTLEQVPDLAMRQRRKRFYLSCGLQELGVEAELFGVNMELLGVRCHLDIGDYRAFYRHHYSPRVAEHVREVCK
jgi:GNAT superfamily N-acetyltransferase